MSKRPATTVLNQNNWDKEDEAEEPGVFQVASSEVLQTRVIKTAKRRMKPSDNNSEAKPSPFLGFSGFGKTSSSNDESPFSFLKQSKTFSNAKENNETGIKSHLNLTKDTSSPLKTTPSTSIFDINPNKNITSTFDESNQSQISKDTTFKPFEHIFKTKIQTQDGDKIKSNNLELLKDLNLSCSSWIAEHLEKNPYCILTPIFKDYEKHLAEINLKSSEESTDKMENFKKSENIENKNFSREEKSSLQNAKSISFLAENEVSETNKGDKKSNEKDKSNEIKLLGFPNPLTNSFNFEFGRSNVTLDSTSTFSLNNISRNPVSTEIESKKEGDDQESDEPPKNDFVPVIEEDSIFDIKCKVFVKKEGSFVSKGVGTLFLKPVEGSKKTQLVVRAHTNLGNILLNTLLMADTPIKKTGKNNAMIVCIPTPECQPPPIPVLIRVKTSEECDLLIKKLEESRG